MVTTTNQGIKRKKTTETNFMEEFANMRGKDIMKNNDWIPVGSGLYPDDMEDVQVTFIGYNDHKPHCEAFAYRNEGEWFWSIDDEKAKVEITAWKYNCEPYNSR